MPPYIVEQILILLITGLAAGLICRARGLPPLMGYLAVGALIGHGGFNIVPTEMAETKHMAEVGVFFLLFSIGLELSPEELRRMSRHLLSGGTTQMLIVAIPLALIFIQFGQAYMSAIVLALALTFSSTVLVFKSLGELGQSSTKLGRRAIAILLFQDAALVPLLLGVPLLTNAESSPGWSQWVLLALATICFLGLTLTLRWFLSVVAIPRIARHRSPDVVVLLTLSVLGSVTLIAYNLGLPPAVGAFAAGLAFGGNRWSEQIDSLILPFREAFSAIFFVSLGLLIDIRATMNDPVVVLLGIVGFVLIKGVGSALALVCTGLPLRLSIPPAFGLAHAGEFSFVLLLFATSNGLLSLEDQQRLFAIAGGSLLISPMLIHWGFRKRAYEVQSEAPALMNANTLNQARSATVIGMGPVGRAVASRLETLGYEVYVMDLNPLNLQSFAQIGLHVVAGEATDSDVLTNANAHTSGVVVISVPVDEIAMRITSTVRGLNPNASILVRCRYAKNLSLLKKSGASFVVAEEAQAATELVRVIEQSLA